MLAAMASQTLFRKLGNAVWDAFIGGSSSTHSSSSSSSSSRGDWDAEKVRKVLEGKAVLRVVDVEPAAAAAAVPTGGAATSAVSSTHSTPSSPKWTGVPLRSSLGQSRSSTITTTAATAVVAATTLSSAVASSSSSNQPHAIEDGSKKCCSITKAAVCDILEESMRSLSLGKKM